MCLHFPRFPQFSRLPIETQRAIVLFLKDDRKVHQYGLVAKRFHTWLERYLYRSVRLKDEAMARAFVDYCLELDWLCKAEVLEIERSVNMSTMADVLDNCPWLTTLTIHSCFRHYGVPEVNLLYEPLSGLCCLKSLSMPLVMLTEDRRLYLPLFTPFLHLTHLHIASSTSNWATIPLGFSGLPHLTHLSLPWDMSRASYPSLQRYLSRSGDLHHCAAEVLVVWVPEDALRWIIRERLITTSLVDTRLVLLRDSQYLLTMARGGFWTYAEDLICWREDTNASPFATNAEIEIQHFGVRMVAST